QPVPARWPGPVGTPATSSGTGSSSRRCGWCRPATVLAPVVAAAACFGPRRRRCRLLGAREFGRAAPATPAVPSGLAGTRRHSDGRLRRSTVAAGSDVEDAASKMVFCFDFDGVVCDSVNESSTTAWMHAKELWPSASLGKSPEPFLGPMRQVRPVVETGWENTLLIQILSEAGVGEVRQQQKGGGAMRQMPGVMPAYGMGVTEDTGTRGGSNQVTDMICRTVLNDWESMRDKRLQELALEPQALIKEFGEVRDKWMAKNTESWLARNQPYEGVPDIIDAMMSRGAEVFVITTKQRRFATTLLKDFGLEFPDDHLFALEDGPKTEVLKSLLAREEYAGKTFHFIEDKLSTLRKVAKDPDLGAVQLHLAEWGYCTEKDRKVVSASIVDGVSILNIKGLESLGVPEPWIY
ncbi:unnamed protein product, partial [Polarella glacialis]